MKVCRKVPGNLIAHHAAYSILQHKIIIGGGGGGGPHKIFIRLGLTLG
jgi:hypothetical protein